jgi:hypothetical protein
MVLIPAEAEAELLGCDEACETLLEAAFAVKPPG